ncbi:MAG: tetratricopeptide repeat protein [Elusimicrobia bacterium]|nr:tetratricopeptide repeat protein [Elusimicrobiota bacterium]
MHLKKQLFLISYLLSLISVFIGCSVDYHFKKAEELRENGKFTEAVERYISIIEKNPESPRIPEAIYRIADLYRQNLENNSEAKKNYRRIINDYPSTEWAKYAKKAMLEIADYHPLFKKAKWVEVDSASYGKYMRAVDEVVSSQNGIFLIKRNLYTRGRIVSSFSKYYKKTKSGVYETDKTGKIIKTILVLPVEIGKKWTTGKIEYTIVSNKENIKVTAGEFSDCIKIKKQLAGASSWSYEYYAPEVGRILLTQSSGSKEKRITELKEFSIPPE